MELICRWFILCKFNCSMKASEVCLRILVNTRYHEGQRISLIFITAFGKKAVMKAGLGCKTICSVHVRIHVELKIASGNFCNLLQNLWHSHWSCGVCHKRRGLWLEVLLTFWSGQTRGQTWIYLRICQKS